MRLFRLFSFVVVLTCSASALSNAQNPVSVRDVLDYRGAPPLLQYYDQEGHSPVTPLFDFGAWHGHLLPTEPAQLADFPGMAIVAEEYLVFLAKQADQLHIEVNGQTEQFDGEVFSEPGMLRQTLRSERCQVQLSLRFVSQLTSMQISDIHCTLPY